MSLVSVVIPCFNHAKFLRETVESVLASTYPHIEVVIVDDGSTDSSREIGEALALEYDIVSYYYQNNAGPCAARNHGISRASGIYILPLDSDDRVSTNYIQEAVNVLNSNQDVKVVYAKARKFGAVEAEWKLKPYTPFNLALDNMIYVSAVYRKEDWVRIDGYTENHVLVREDWEFWIKMLKDGGEVVKLPFVGFYYRIHENSRRKSMNKMLKRREVAYLNKHHADFFQEYLNGPLRNNRSMSRFINLFKK